MDEYNDPDRDARYFERAMLGTIAVGVVVAVFAVIGMVTTVRWALGV